MNDLTIDPALFDIPFKEEFLWEIDYQAIQFNKYKETESRYFSFFDNCESVVAYGRFGSVKAPGLSDLDLIVVVHDEALRNGTFKLPVQIGIENYIFQHQPMVIPESLVSKINLYHLINVEWVSDRIGVPNIEYSDSLAALHVLDKTIYLQKIFYDIVRSRGSTVRRTVLALTSLVRSLEWMRDKGASLSTMELVYIERVLAFRQEMVEGNLDSIDNFLTEMISTALYLSVLITEKLVDQLLVTTENIALVGCNETVLYFRPMTFAKLVDKKTLNQFMNVSQNGIISKLVTKTFGARSRGILGYNICVGPLTLRYIFYSTKIEREYIKSFSGYSYEYGAIEETAVAWPDDIRDLMIKRANANWEFTKFFQETGILDSNFSNFEVPELKRLKIRQAAQYIFSRRLIRKFLFQLV